MGEIEKLEIGVLMSESEFTSGSGAEHPAQYGASVLAALDFALEMPCDLPERKPHVAVACMGATTVSSDPETARAEAAALDVQPHTASHLYVMGCGCTYAVCPTAAEILKSQLVETVEEIKAEVRVMAEMVGMDPEILLAKVEGLVTFCETCDQGYDLLNHPDRLEPLEPSEGAEGAGA